MSPLEALRGILALGGPVVAVLLVMSVLAFAVALYKFWQFAASGVGRHKVLSEALGRLGQGRSAHSTGAPYGQSQLSCAAGSFGDGCTGCAGA